MAAYVVMQKEGADEPVPVVFVRDGFHWPAFFLPVLWLLWHRLWIEAALALGLTMLLSAAGEFLGLGFYASILALLVSLYFGLEGPALRIRALARRGWRERAVLEAPRLGDAELAYFGGTLEDEADALPENDRRVLPTLPVHAASRPAAAPAAIGLVPYPGKS